MFHFDSGRKPRIGRLVGRTVLAAVAIGVLTFAMLSVTACGTPSSNGGAGGSTTTSPGDSFTHPTGSDQVVLQVITGGGFVPIEYNLTALPEFSLYGDGRVIVPGPVIAIYPGPALPNLQSALIPEEAIQALLSAAREAGLFQNGVDYGQPPVADAPTTTFLVNVGGTTYRSEVYALGIEDVAGGLSLEQQQARAALQSFRGKLTDLTSFVTDPISWAPYEYAALAVYSLAVDPNVTTDSTDVVPNRLDWPLADLSTLGVEVQGGFRRVVISGDDLRTLQQEPPLEKATAITLWKSGDLEYHLWFRPLLPDERS